MVFPLIFLHLKKLQWSPLLLAELSSPSGVGEGAERPLGIPLFGGMVVATKF